MATFQTITEAVEGNLIDLPSFVQTSIPALINRAYRQAQSMHNFWVMRGEAARTTTLQTLALGAARPTDFKEYRGKPYYTDETGGKQRLRLVPDLDNARAIWDTEDEGPPEGIAEALPTDAGVVFWNVYPLPDGWSDFPDGEYRITIPYWRYLPELSADGDTSWLVNEGEAYLEAEATRLGFIKDWDEERADYWRGEATSYWNKLLLRDKYMHLSLTENLATHTGPYEPTSE